LPLKSAVMESNLTQVHFEYNLCFHYLIDQSMGRKRKINLEDPQPKRPKSNPQPIKTVSHGEVHPRNKEWVDKPDFGLLAANFPSFARLFV
jgi:hypothetical protein